MPRYDYRCTAGHVYERQEPFRSPSEHPCEKCGKLARRVLVAPPLVFKSDGFYVTSGRDTTPAPEGPAKGVRSKKPPKTSDDAGSSSSSASSASASAPSED